MMTTSATVIRDTPASPAVAPTIEYSDGVMQPSNDGHAATMIEFVWYALRKCQLAPDQ